MCDYHDGYVEKSSILRSEKMYDFFGNYLAKYTDPLCTCHRGDTTPDDLLLNKSLLNHILLLF